MKFSHSALWTYQTCPLQYRFKYVDKLPVATQSANMSFILGNSVHGTLEFLHKEALWENIPTRQAILSFYQSARDEEFQEALKKFWGDNPFENDFIQQNNNNGKVFVSRYYDTYHPFDRDITMQTELSITDPLTDDITISGKVDRVSVKGDTIIIYDYKTSKSYDKDNKDKVKKQIALYGYIIQKWYKEKCKKIIWRAIYLRLENEIERELTPELMQEVINEYQTLAQEIVTKVKSYEDSKSDDLFVPKGWPHCKFCDYQVLCPLFKHKYQADEEIKLTDLKVSTIRHIIDEYRTLSEQVKHLEWEKEIYKKLLVDYANENNYKILYGTDTKLGITRRKEYYPNKEKLEEIREMLSKWWLLDKVMDIKNSEYSKLFKDGKLNPEECKELISISNIEYPLVQKLKEWELDNIEEIGVSE